MLFDWNDGNRAECENHGATANQIETLLRGDPFIGPDPYAGDKTRFRAVNAAAARQGVPYSRFVRRALERAVTAQ